MMKVHFDTKSLSQDYNKLDEFIIEKVVEVSLKEFSKYINGTLSDFDYIKENKHLMFIDEKQVWHCIFLTAKELDHGILIQSDGHNFARYSAYLEKSELEGVNQ